MNENNNAGRPHATMPISEDSGLPLYRAAPVSTMLQWAIHELLGALPEKRDWLNPDAERELRAALAATAAQPIAPPTELTAKLRRWAGTANGYAPVMFRKAADEIERLTVCAQPIAPAADVSAPTDERAAFEANFIAEFRAAGETEEYIALALQRGSKDEYYTTFVQGRWDGWQAARAAAPVSGPTDAHQAFVDAHRKEFPQPVSDQVGCERDDGLLNIHSEDTTCEVCKPVSGQGATELPPLPPMDHIADIPGVCRVVAYSANAMTSYGQLCIDSRPRSEDSRAEAAKVELEIQAGFNNGMDLVQRFERNRNAALEEAAQLVEQLACGDDPLAPKEVRDSIRALASSAAPESDKRTLDQKWRLDDLRKAAPSSGESADAMPVAWRYKRERYEEVHYMDANEVALELQGKSTKGFIPLRANASFNSWEPLYTGPSPAAHSSAPSEAEKRAAYRELNRKIREAGFSGEESDAAPTGESLPVQGGALNDALLRNMNLDAYHVERVCIDTPTKDAP